MTIDLPRLRLFNQGLSRTAFRSPAEAVSWLGAVQAQDFAGACWALGQRMKGHTRAAVESAFDKGHILRTHVLRPTWHFVVPRDIRWMLDLTAPRVRARMAPYDRRLGLDRATFARSRPVLARALRDRQWKTRAELAATLGRAGLVARGQRLGHLMMNAELEGLVCSGPLRGKQFTYALVEERAPDARRLKREEALAQLVRRYFRSHGPATARDFAWWSGLTVRDARAGLDAVGSRLAQETVGDRTYFFEPSRRQAARPRGSFHLLPNYDEYLIAYQDRGPDILPQAGGVGWPAFPHHLIRDGQLVGAWKRSVEASRVLVEVAPYIRLSRAETPALKAAVVRYGRFLEKAPVLTVRS